MTGHIFIANNLAKTLRYTRTVDRGGDFCFACTDDKNDVRIFFTDSKHLCVTRPIPLPHKMSLQTFVEAIAMSMTVNLKRYGLTVWAKSIDKRVVRIMVELASRP